MARRNRGHWRTWPEYQFEEANPDPRMRPSVDALAHKLRHMTMLVDHPDAVEFIIHDMMHWFFIREEVRPTRMFNTMMHSNTLWRMALRAETEGSVNASEPAAYVEDLDLLRARGWVRDRPAEPDLSSPAKPGLIDPLELNALMLGAIVANHKMTYTDEYVLCGCGKHLDGAMKWARHVGIQIKRRLSEEPTEAATEEASASPSA